MVLIGQFIGAITGSTLTITTMRSGFVAVGHTVMGDHVPADTRITLLGSGAGQEGTYALSKALPLGVAAEHMTSGSDDLITAAELTTTTTRMIIPLVAQPSQILTVGIGGQNCNLNVYQRTTGLYVDLGINGKLLIGGVIAHDRCKIVRDIYLGFKGDLAFWDSQGREDPNWTELSTRYFLGYFAPT
jgi:hypothetical protein